MTEYYCLECAICCVAEEHKLRPDLAREDSLIVVQRFLTSCSQDNFQECISCGEHRHVADWNEAK